MLNCSKDDEAISCHVDDDPTARKVGDNFFFLATLRLERSGGTEASA
jgi:hypothetical protein